MRTKYDRMFERTNQSILTPHYTALIGQDNEEGEEDVFTMARRDHALEGEDDPSLLDEESSTIIPKNGEPLVSSEDLSKRKLKAGTSRKAQLKTRPAPEKLVFDDSGAARDFYEHGVEAEQGAAERRKVFVEGQREEMKEADRVDREVARERRREKKRKRKDREREVSQSGYDFDRKADSNQALDGSDDGDEGAVAFIGGSPGSEPDFEVEEEPERPVKGKKHKALPADLEDEEALALRLLQGS